MLKHLELVKVVEVEWVLELAIIIYKIDNHIDTHNSKTLKKKIDADNYFDIAINFDTGYNNYWIFAHKQQIWVTRITQIIIFLKIDRQGKTENQLRISDSESLERNTG